MPPPHSDAPPDPEVKAFLVCDQIIHDAGTNKKSLIGVFHDLASTRFPAVHPSLWIYANLTDARGRYTFEFRLVDVERNQVLGSGSPPPMDIPDPVRTTEFAAQLRNVALPAPGTYEFHLVANRQLIATKAIRVTLVDAKGRPQPPAPPGAPAPPAPPSH
jgi:hypothetical protein